MALPADLVRSLLRVLPTRRLEELPLPPALWQQLLAQRFPQIKLPVAWQLTTAEQYLLLATLSGDACHASMLFLPEAAINAATDPRALPVLTDILCRDTKYNYDKQWLLYAAMHAQNYAAVAWLFAFIDLSEVDEDLFIKLVIAGDIIITLPLLEIHAAYEQGKITVFDFLHGFRAPELLMPDNYYYTVGYLYSHPDDIVTQNFTAENIIPALNLLNLSIRQSDATDNITALRSLASARLLPTTADFPTFALDGVELFDPVTLQERAAAMAARVLAIYPDSVARQRYLQLLDFISHPTGDWAAAELPAKFLLIFGRVDLISDYINNDQITAMSLVLYYTRDFPRLLHYLDGHENGVESSKVKMLALLRGHGLLLRTMTNFPLVKIRTADFDFRDATNSFLLQHLLAEMTEVEVVDGELRCQYRGRTFTHNPRNHYGAATWRALGFAVGNGISDGLFVARLARVTELLQVL